MFRSMVDGIGMIAGMGMGVGVGVGLGVGMGVGCMIMKHVFPN
jgi:hypothetical protein